jgi:integrase
MKRGHVRHRHAGDCPPRCRVDAPWQGLVYVGRDPITKRKRYKSVTCKTKRAAEEATAALLARYAGRSRAPADPTVAELLERWMAAADLRPSTRRRTRSIIHQNIVPHLGSRRLDRLDGADLDSLYQHLLTRGKKCQVCWSRIGRGLPALRDRQRYATSAAAEPPRRCGAPTPNGTCRKWARKHDTHCERHGGTDLQRPLDRVHLGDCVKGVPMEPSTVRRVHNVLRSALEWATRKRHWIDRNPADDASPPGQGRSKVHPPGRDDVARILADAREHDFEWFCWLRLDALTGARRGEVCAVQWRDVDRDAGVVTMQWSITPDTDKEGRPLLDANGRRELTRGPTKADTTKRLELDPLTLALLAELRQRAGKRAEEVGLPLRPDAYVFSPDPAGRIPWRPDTMTQRFRRLRARLDLDGVALRDLRHWAASNMLLGGIDLVRAAATTGHEKETMLRFYAQYLGGGREAVALLAGLVDAAAPEVAAG